MRRNYVVLIAASLAMSIPGCQNERHETPTKGHVTVVVSESVSPVMQQEKQIFEEQYPEAHVELIVASDREAIARLFNDSITVIVSSRPLNAEERAVQKRFNITLREFKIAYDGVAVIVNKANSLTRLRTTQLDSILDGRITRWKDVGSDLSSTIETCLPSRNSGTFEVTVTKLMNAGDTVAMPAAVVLSSGEMIAYVIGHPSALGFIGTNWLNENKEKVTALELADPNVPDSLGTKGKYFSPHQAYIYQGNYPLTREIYIYSRADAYGVGSGFLSFITGAQGQKIILNNGLVPATMPVRLVELTNKNLSNFSCFLINFGTFA